MDEILKKKKPNISVTVYRCFRMFDVLIAMQNTNATKEFRFENTFMPSRCVRKKT